MAHLARVHAVVQSRAKEGQRLLQPWCVNCTQPPARVQDGYQ